MGTHSHTVDSHTHSLSSYTHTTGIQSASHYHTDTSGNNSANHGHNFHNGYSGNASNSSTYTYAKTKEEDNAQELGAGKYIKKPYTLEKVGVVVKEELEK